MSGLGLAARSGFNDELFWCQKPNEVKRLALRWFAFLAGSGHATAAKGASCTLVTGKKLPCAHLCAHPVVFRPVSVAAGDSWCMK